jgi:hypothetical protein
MDGLLAGGSASLSGGGRLLYGLFGSFDYGGPVLLRHSETGLGPGIVITTSSSGWITAEATLFASGTFGTAGGRVPIDFERDYRYGFGTLVATRGRVGLLDRVSLEAGARAFTVPSAVGGGTEDFLVATASAVVRLGGSHALSLDGILSRRSVSYTDSRYGESSRFAGVSYAYLVDGP